MNALTAAAVRGQALLPLALSLCAALSLTGLLTGCSTNRDDQKIAAEIRRDVARPFRWFKKPTLDDDDVQPLVRRFYEKRGFRPAWTRLGGPTDKAKDLLEVLAAAREHGLAPDDYDLARLRDLREKADPPLGAEGDPDRLAALDVELTRNALKYAAHRAAGQVVPTQLPAEWHIKTRQRDLVAILGAAIEKDRLRATFDDLDPAGRPYAQLREALHRLRQLEAEGGWGRVTPGAALGKGAAGPRVLALQRRLAASGELDANRATGRFDDATAAAVREFQYRHGLPATGVVATEELRHLNVPVAERIRQVELNLERWRWVPDSLFKGRYLEVNIPEYAMRVFEKDKPVLAMRVVVGKRFSPTPIFSDEISYLVINPYWNVPPSIATEEILVELKKDPGYLERNKMKLLERAGEDAPEVDARSVNWDAMEAGDFRYAIRQDPGPYNPVGHVKFMCPNQFNVYLHDTPADRLFDEPTRSFSHGCIRLERPVDLAEYVLKDEPGWDRGRIEASFDSAHNRSVILPKPLPVHIMYWTAFVDDKGRLHFRDDVYGLDKLLDRTLRSPRPGITTPVRADGPDPAMTTRRSAGAHSRG